MPLPQRKAPEPWISDPAAEVYEGGVTFRTTLAADGKVKVLALPPTRENVLDVRVEDKVSQTNYHARILSPLAVAVRAELESREGPRYGVFEDLLVLLKPHGYNRDVAPDVLVCSGVHDPEAVGESLDVIAEGYPVQLVVEVVSTKYKAHKEKDEVLNVALYDRLGAVDYAMIYPQVEARGEPLRIAAKTRGPGGSFVDNPPDRWGRIRLPSLDLWISVDAQGRLALQDVKTGKRIYFHVDEKRLRLVAEARAEDAERRVGEEARARREADLRAEEAIRTQAEIIVLVLESRGLDLTAAERRRILACRDTDTLRSWAAAAGTVRAPADLRSED